MSSLSGSDTRSRSGLRHWELWTLPQDLLAFVLLIDLVGFVVGGIAVLGITASGGQWLRCVMLIALFAAFERISARIERLRTRMTDSHQIDLTSVWTFAAVIALPTGLAVLLVLILYLSPVRVRRPVGARPHRLIFSVSSVVLATVGASDVLSALRPHTAGLLSGLNVAVSIVVALVVYTVVNTALVGFAIYLAARPIPVRALFGTGEENVLEFATLCLGALVAVTTIYLPWLTVVALVPMYVLQRGALIRQLEIAATTDPKTGLLNAVTWQQVAKKGLALAERDRHGAALFIIDMDNFKTINDTHGHIAGDKVLEATAACLTHELRDADIIGRFGGEEFVALLCDVDASTAEVIAERILQGIRALELPSPADPTVLLTGFSASIGIALYPRHGFEVEELLQAADTALYQAKRSGRDRVGVVGRAPSDGDVRFGADTPPTR